MLKLVHSKGIRHIDSARIYAGGKTESILGECFKQLEQDIPNYRASTVVTTKVHPSQPNGLSARGIRDQLQSSLQAMGLTRVDELYLHQPDAEHSLKDSLEAVHECVKGGLVGRVGMSNYHETEVQRALDICEQNNWTKPSIYQGLYNPLNRRVEASLLPLLKKNQIDFVAYNPLAAGLLTGKHTPQSSDVLPGRFKNNQNYLPRFYTDSNFRAVDLIKAALPEGMNLVTATYLWLQLHSCLCENDGILLGASSIEQLEENIAACDLSQGVKSLPSTLLDAFEKAWEITQENSFPYWRSYSLDHPDRDNLDPGAAYSATK